MNDPAPIAFDPELLSVLEGLEPRPPVVITAEMIPHLRANPRFVVTSELLEHSGIEARDAKLTSFDDAEITVSILQPHGRSGIGPGIYFVHGGGMVMGDRWSGSPLLFEWLHKYNAVAVTIEYRLAPEHPDPTPVEDTYAGLQWVFEHAIELGIDPARIITVGASAGGGLAAGASLLARDRGGPRVAGQMLAYPMLDDRDATVSTHQLDGLSNWSRGSNLTGWTALLGDRRGGDDVSIYAAPARATDLSGLPPTFIDCGSADAFRDEDIAFANAIWAAGGVAELHVWPGGFHSFESVAPHHAMSQQLTAVRSNWLARIWR